MLHIDAHGGSKLKNKYLENLNKIEFVVTNDCTGRCKHCSQGDHRTCGEFIDPEIAASAVSRIARLYDIKTVMTFGGEPLLYPKAVYAVMETATSLGVAKRQVITNGYFTKDGQKMREIAEGLSKSGVNDLLISVDAFHQETIPLGAVKGFARAAKEQGIPTRLQPAWLVSPDHVNPYNEKTREILAAFADLDIPTGNGNVIFPEGNALEYLEEYFADGAPENPYEEDPRDIRCLSFSPNGDVLDGNVYKTDILEIIENYRA